MRRVSGSALIVLVVVAGACKDTTRPEVAAVPVTPTPLDGKGSVTPVSLSVTISNTDALGNAYGIQNDGQGAYVDGTQYVVAQLDQYGTFAFNTFVTNTHGATAIRWYTYDFSHPVDPTNTFRPAEDKQLNFHVSSGASQEVGAPPWVPIQNLGVNGNPTSQCGYMGNSFSANADTAYRVSFHKELEDNPSSPTAFMVVTRTSVSPAVWTVQAVGSCSPNSNVAALRNNNTNQLMGYYVIPFFMTLTAK